MRQSAWMLGVALAFGAGSAFAQSTLAPSAPTVIGVDQYSPGVNVSSTLYPRPTSNLTQSAVSSADRYSDTYPTQSGGIPAGSVIFYPSLTTGAFFDDNVFASQTNRQGDWAGFVRPEIAVRSNNWTAVQAAGAAFVEQRWYSKFKSEDQFNAGVAAGFTARPADDTQLVGRFAYLHAHEDRGTSDQITNTTVNPIAYDQIEAAGALNQRFDRVWTSFGAAVALLHFDNAVLVGGTPLNQNYRNGSIVQVPGRVGYVVAPSTSVFFELAENWRSFDVPLFDSHGLRAVGGWLFEPGQGSRIKGEVWGGYMQQTYSGAGMQQISTYTFGGSLAFLVAQNVTAVWEGRREAKEASLSGGLAVGTPGDAVSVEETLVSGRIDWRVLPKVVVGGGAAYLEDVFLGAARTDRTWSPLASVKYFASPNLLLSFDYRYVNFDSTGLAIPSYYRNVYLFAAHLHM